MFRPSLQARARDPSTLQPARARLATSTAARPYRAGLLGTCKQNPARVRRAGREPYCAAGVVALRSKNSLPAKKPIARWAWVGAIFVASSGTRASA